jgi:hypothetical protein
MWLLLKALDGKTCDAASCTTQSTKRDSDAYVAGDI